MLNRMRSAARNENGQTLVEYGLIVTVVSVALMAALGIFELSLSSYWTEITAKLKEILEP